MVFDLTLLSLCIFLHLSIILSPTHLSFSSSFSFYLPDHLPILLVTSLHPLSPSPISLFSSISLTSPELRGIQDRQVAVVTGRAGIFYISFFFFFTERGEAEEHLSANWCIWQRQTERTRFGFRVMNSQRCCLHTCFYVSECLSLNMAESEL